MAVPSSGIFTLGLAKPLEKLGVLDRLFRLAGDLSQRHFVKVMTDVLVDYAEIPIKAIGIGLITEYEEPWIKPPMGWTPSDERTSLAGMRKDKAVCIMAEGAQMASLALCQAGFMSPDQRSSLQRFWLTKKPA